MTGWWILIAVCFPALSAAQTNIQSLEECLKQAMENNLTLQSGRIAVEKAKTLQATAFNIEKTGFSMSQDPTAGGSPDNSLSLSQSFAFPSIYIARRNVLKAETELERNRLELSVNELEKEVTGAYYRLLYAREILRIRHEQDSIYSRFLFLASAKFRVGETNRLEQIHAEKLSNENKLEIQKAESNLQNIRLMLQQWLNTEQSIEPQEDSLPVMTMLHPVSSLDRAQTPSGKIYASLLKVSEKNVSLSRQEFLPDFNFSLRNQFLLKGFNPYSIARERFGAGNFMGFELGISLPLFFGEQRAKSKAAQKEVERLRTQQESAFLTLQKEYEAGLNEYYKAQTALVYFTGAGKRQAEEIAQMAQLSYEKGEIGYIEYIQHLQTVVEMHLQQADAINEYNQAIIRLNFLQGNSNSIK
jgi:cobalt-zinc-cadmium resistance protein CzcA